MGFHGGAATLYPVGCGDRERHWPVAFELTHASCGGKPLPHAAGSADHDDRRVRIDRGACLEVWDLAHDHVEQSFRFERPVGDGDLRLAIRCDTGRTFARGDRGELRFSRPDGSVVVCSDALAVDAVGRTLPLELGWQQDQMVLTVPATWLRAATWPVLVDPIVRVIGVATTPTTFRRPQVAFDPTANVWLIVVEDEVAATDTDVAVFRLALDGTVLDSGAIEVSPDRALSPDVGALAAHGKFLIAYRNDTTSRLVRRFCDAATFTFGPVALTVLTGTQSSKLVRVGGAKVGDRVLVCLTEGILLVEQLLAFTVDEANVASASVQMAGGTGTHSGLEVTDLGATTGDWGVATRVAAGGRFFGVHAGSGAAAPTVSTPVTLPGAGVPKIAGQGPFLVVATDAASPPEILATSLTANLGGSYTIAFTENLTVLENPTSSSPITNRRDLTVASDGCRFVFTFREDHTNTPTVTILSTIRQVRRGFTDSFVFDERRAGSGLVGTEPVLGAAGATGGPPSTYLLVAPLSGPNSPLGAVRYDGRVGGDMFELLPHGCGAPFQPLIGATGLSVLGGAYSVRLQRTVGVPLLLGGFPEPLAVPACVGNPACLRGVQLPVPTVEAGGTITVQVPCVASMLGVRLAFQGVDLLGPGGCPVSAFGIDFRLSDTLIATVR